MKKIILSSLFLLFFKFNIGQESIKKCNEEVISGIEKRVGCIDVEGNLHGYGTYTLQDGSLLMQGEWKRGKLDGKGKKITVTNDQTQTYNGIFNKGILIDGEIKTEFSNGDVKLKIYELKELIKTKYTWENKSNEETNGEHYKNGELKNGVKKNIYVDNRTLKSIYKNGEIIDEKLNTNNYYVEDDLVGEGDSINIPLEIEEGDNTMYVNLNIPTKKNPNYSARFIFDTGAEKFSIGYRLFNDLKAKGLDYIDLKVNISSVGISGIPINNNAIIIKELKIGEYTIKNVVAMVKMSETANYSLLGMGFLKKFREVNWSLIAKELVFYK